MLTDYAAADDQELWNTARLAAYLESMGSPFATGPGICTCDSLTPEILGDDPYTTPGDVDNPAPWYDPAVPESADFLGFLPLRVDGIDDNPRGRTVSGAVGGGGVFGPQRDLPRTITVTGVVIGTTCCAAQYGLQYLSEALAGCTGDACDGSCLTMYNCCPDPGLTPEQFNAAHRRTFRRTALVSGPTVVGRSGSGSCATSNCAAGAELLDVEFVLVAGTPWAWTDIIPLLEVTPPIGGDGDCIEWCLSGVTTGPNGCDPSTCLFQDCLEPGDPFEDPMNAPPAPPQPSLPLASFCVPLAPVRDCYDIDLSTRPQWSVDVPFVQVYSGAQPLRNIRITWYQKPDGTLDTCDEVADANLCDPVQDLVITYLPPRTTLIMDGAVGRASVSYGDQACRTSSTAYGSQDGGPVEVAQLSCATFCVCIETDPNFPPAADAVVAVSVVGRGY